MIDGKILTIILKLLKFNLKMDEGHWKCQKCLFLNKWNNFACNNCKNVKKKSQLIQQWIPPKNDETVKSLLEKFLSQKTTRSLYDLMIHLNDFDYEAILKELLEQSLDQIFNPDFFKDDEYYVKCWFIRINVEDRLNSSKLPKIFEKMTKNKIGFKNALFYKKHADFLLSTGKEKEAVKILKSGQKLGAEPRHIFNEKKYFELLKKYKKINRINSDLDENLSKNRNFDEFLEEKENFDLNFGENRQNLNKIDKNDDFSLKIDQNLNKIDKNDDFSLKIDQKIDDFSTNSFKNDFSLGKNIFTPKNTKSINFSPKNEKNQQKTPKKEENRSKRKIAFLENLSFSKSLKSKKQLDLKKIDIGPPLRVDFLAKRHHENSLCVKNKKVEFALVKEDFEDNVNFQQKNQKMNQNFDFFDKNDQNLDKNEQNLNIYDSNYQNYGKNGVKNDDKFLKNENLDKKIYSKSHDFEYDNDIVKNIKKEIYPKTEKFVKNDKKRKNYEKYHNKLDKKSSKVENFDQKYENFDLNIDKKSPKNENFDQNIDKKSPKNENIDQKSDKNWINKGKNGVVKRRFLTKKNDVFKNLDVFKSKCIVSLINSDGRKKYYFLINNEKYDLINLIGRGGTSSVYKVFNRKSSKKFALKHIVICDASIIENFNRETEILLKLRAEPSIIKLINFQKDFQNLFMVLELADQDMASFLHANAPLDVFSARYFWGQMVKAVSVLHSQRIVHKDLKPQNFVLVNSSVKLIDFGLADTVSENTIHIYNSKKEGTPNYMAPECLIYKHNFIKVRKETDIWSLGIILYEMMVGHPPFHTLQMSAKLTAITDNIKIPFDKITHPAVLDLIKKCLNRNPDKRPSTKEIFEHPFLKICSKCSFNN